MKKIILLASALVLGGTAYAQDASMQPPASGSTMPATPDASAPPAPMPDPSAPPAATTPDASAPAAAPDGAMPAGGAPSAAPTTASGDLPTCSRTVTDSCKQGSGGKAHHRMAHKKR